MLEATLRISESPLIFLYPLYRSCAAVCISACGRMCGHRDPSALFAVGLLLGHVLELIRNSFPSYSIIHTDLSSIVWRSPLWASRNPYL